jgi:hypothetical protein
MKKTVCAFTLLIAAQAYCGNDQNALTKYASYVGAGLLGASFVSDNSYIRGVLGIAGIGALMYAQRPVQAQEQHTTPSQSSSQSASRRSSTSSSATVTPGSRPDSPRPTPETSTETGGKNSRFKNWVYKVAIATGLKESQAEKAARQECLRQAHKALKEASQFLPGGRPN